ncbi:MAG: hypothetical protein AAGD33_13195 [Actinomycetota bacterium]
MATSSTPPVSGPKRLRSPLTRALAPVLGGIAFFVLLALVTWGIAAYLSRSGTEPTERLAPIRLELGAASNRASDVAEEGPLLFPDLETIDGARSIVLDHTGDDPLVGWRLYYAFPADRPSCPVTQVRGTATFLDCDGGELDVTELSPPTEDVRPVVEDEQIYLDLRAFSSTPESDQTG